MANSIIYDSGIRHLNNITWNKVSQLEEIPTALAHVKLTRYHVSSQDSRPISDQAVIDFKDRLIDLQRELDRYNPSLIQKIINFFTGRMFTLCRLSKTLSEIISVVTKVTKKILDNQVKELREQKKKAIEEAKAKAKKDEENRIKALEEARKKARLDQYQNAMKDAKAVISGVSTAATKVFEAFAQLDAPDEDAIAKGDEIRVNESNIPITPEELSYKTALVGRAKQIVDNYVATYSAKPIGIHETETPDYSLKTALKAQKYIRTLLIKLAQNKNVPLPRWYHATGKDSDPLGTVESIIKSKFLWQKVAPFGYGVFFSSRDEFEAGYGDYTFAVDEGALSEKVLNPIPGTKKPRVEYFYYDQALRQEKASLGKRDRYSKAVWIRVSNTTPEQDKNSSMWIAENCVPVNPNTVAFLAATKTSEVRESFRTLNFKVSVLPRQESDFIRLIFDAAETQRTPTRRDIAEDVLERNQQKTQTALVKYRENGTLVAVGGRYIPQNWKQMDYSLYQVYSQNLYHLTYKFKSPYCNLTPTFGKISQSDLVRCVTQNYTP